MNKSSLKQTLQFFLGWPLSLCSLFFIFTLIKGNLALIMKQLQSVSFPFLIAGIVMFLIYFFLRSYAWHQLLLSYGYHIPLISSLFLWQSSEMKRYVPGNIWSFVSRTALFTQYQVKKSDSVYLLFLEMQLILLSSFLLSLFSIPLLFDIFPHLSTLIYGIALCAIGIAGIGIFIFLFQNTSISLLKKKSFPLQKFITPFLVAAEKNTSLSRMIKFLTIFLGIFFCFGLGNFFISSSLFPLPEEKSLFIIALFAFSLFAGYAAIIFPMGLGVREAVITIGLSPFVPLHIAALSSLIIRVILICSDLLYFGILFFCSIFIKK